MEYEIVVPSTADGALMVTIVSWVKNVGDAVTRGEDLAEAATEKITLYVTAPANGRLTEIRRAAGDKVSVGEVIGVMTAEADA